MLNIRPTGTSFLLNTLLAGAVLLRARWGPIGERDPIAPTELQRGCVKPAHIKQELHKKHIPPAVLRVGATDTRWNQ